MTSAEREDYAKEVADLKANLNEDKFISLWADGRSMSMDEAVSFALDDIHE